MKISWQHVAIVGMVLGTITALSLKGQDISALLSILALLFIGMGLIVGNQQAQRDQTNGTMTQLVSLVEGMAKQLAEAVPPKVIESSAQVTKEEEVSKNAI